MTEVAVMISQAMDNAVNAAAFSYRDLINEAFIAPIRSAVVVDDEFPTLDEFLNDKEAAGRKKYADRAREIICFCRNRTPYPWIVDVHDGKIFQLTRRSAAQRISTIQICLYWIIILMAMLVEEKEQ